MKIISLCIIMLFCLSFVSAGTLEQPIKQGETFDLVQTCSDCTFVELTSVTYPNGTKLQMNVNMTKTGEDYSYSFGNTTQLGTYKYNTCGDLYQSSTATRITTCEVISFEVTTNGNDKPDAILIVVFSLIFIAIFFFGLFAFFKALEQVVQFKMDLIDTLTLMGSYFAMWIFYYFSFEYLGNSFVNTMLELAIKIGAFTHVFLALVGFMVSFIMTNLKFKQKARVTY